MSKTRKAPYRHWRKGELKAMRRMAGKYPRRKIARELGRTEGAIAQQAHMIGLSLRVMRHG